MNLVKRYWPIITFIVALGVVALNIGTVVSIIGTILRVLNPLFIGIAIAFVLNILMRTIEGRFFSEKRFGAENWLFKKRRGISLLLTYAAAILALSIITLFILPQLVSSVSTLLSSLPQYGKELSKWTGELYTSLGLSSEWFTELLNGFKDIFLQITSFTANTLKGALDMTLSITAVALNAFMGLVFSVYLLAKKETYIEVVSRINRAVNPAPVAAFFSRLADESSHVFSRFVGGQILEALILGTLCFLGMTALGLPYTPLISVIIGVTCLIPYVGAFIGTIPSLLIIAMESFPSAIVFLVFILILQQVEGNFIYPKVVGDVIGLDGFWVFLAITIGGGLFGVFGMLVGVPIMALLHTFVGEWLNKRLESPPRKSSN